MRALLLFLASASTLACSGPTAYLTLDTPTPTPTPSVPTGILATAGTSQFTVLWNPAPATENVLNYRVYSAATEWTSWESGLPGAHLATNLGCCTFTRAGVLNETRYWAAVSAVNAGGESLQSAHVTTRPPGWPGTRQFGSPQTESVHAIATAPNGSSVIVGGTNGSLNGQAPQGGYDAYLMHVDAGGSLRWTTQIGTSVTDEALGVALTADAAIVVGITSGSLGGTNAGSIDLFVSKHRLSDGEVEWIKQFGTGPGNDHANGVAIDAAGNIYVVGLTAGALNGVTSNGTTDAFAMKLDANGDHVWTTLIGTSVADYADAVSVDGAGNVFVAGKTAGALDGANTGGLDFFVSRMNAATGSVTWIKQRGSASEDYPWSVSVDGAGGIYLAVSSAGGLDGYTPSSTDGYVLRFDIDGNRLWTTQLSTTDVDSVYAVRALSGTIFAAGMTQGAFGGATNEGGYDAVLFRLDAATGDMLSSAQFGTPGFDRIAAIDIIAAGAIVAAGETTGAFDGAANAGSTDIFLSKHDPVSGQPL